MRLSRFYALAAMACALSFGAQATALLLPPSNALTVGVYGDFSVYSLDLLEKCAAAGDARCLPGGPYPVQSGPGQIQSQLIIYANSNGGASKNYDAGSGPFAPGTAGTVKVDDPFDAPAGITTTFDTTAAGEPATTWAGGTDKAGRWDANLASVLNYLTSPSGVVNDLVFLFDNNQQGSNLDQQQFIWAQIRILDAAGNEIGKCYELNSSPGVAGSDCADTGPNPNPTFTAFNAPTDYVGTVGRFCVDTVTGAGYNQGAANAGACTNNPGDYFVNNNLGDSNAEFAAYVGELDDNLVAWAALGYSMSINLKMRNLNGAGEQLWICDNCNVPDLIVVPEPSALALAGLALFALAAVSRRRKAR